MKSPNEPPSSVRSLTRRQSLKGAMLALGGIATVSATAWAAADDGIIRNAEAIHQEPVFAASPKRIYDALTDAKQFQKVQLFSGAAKATDVVSKPAQISDQPGGSFFLFGGYITGRQLELVSGKRIVQAWHSGSWAADIYSIAKFDLVAQDKGTKIVFDHTGFPAGQAEHLASGWKDNYWDALAQYLK